MAFAPDIKKPTARESAGSYLVEKVRWSLRQRLRKQLSQLSASFFDEVDDFLFASGQQGQFSDDSAYLKSMRELRAKQGLFEETFINSALRQMKDCRGRGRGRESSDNSIFEAGAAEAKGHAVYEGVETDIALRAMSRRAGKFYLPFIKQIDTVQEKFCASADEKIIANDMLISATLGAFAETQSVFNLTLDVRLVLFKLFEQHFLLKMEKLFLDIISIISNMHDDSFVEKLYSSSSAFKTKITPRKQSENRLTKHRSGVANKAAHKSDAVEAAVDQLVASLCADKELPLFLEKMVRLKWRAVMFLIGLNKGILSVEWGEARHTASLLTSIASKQIPMSQVESESIIGSVRQGFSLIQMEEREQEDFLSQLSDLFRSESSSEKTQFFSPEQFEDAEIETDASEASISPSGEKILDRDDLNELAKILGGQDTGVHGPNSETRLADYLNQIDQLGDHLKVEYLINNNYEQCLLSKPEADAELYSIENRKLRLSLSRSRLGLAVALKDGELRIPRLNTSSTAQTILQGSAGVSAGSSSFKNPLAAFSSRIRH